VRVDEIADYRGQPTLRIETGRGGAIDVTYHYHRVGAGFASIVDRDGRDWISWRPGGGPDGEYRGIPNLGVGRCCHPGYGGELAMITTVEERAPARAVIRSAGAGGFVVRWTSTPTHATLAVVRAPRTYWFLYEGTPGGAIEDGDEIVFLGSGDRIPVASGRWDRDMPDPEWVSFADATLDRSLLFAHHEPDGLPETYFRMGKGAGGMTVWGVGRGGGLATHLAGTNHLTIALVESRDPAVLKAAAMHALSAP
jgi:hypothetical protein